MADPEGILPPWQWWAPVTAMMIAAVTLLSSQFSVLNFQGRGHGSLMATAVLSQPELVAYLPDAGHSEANAWPGTSFDWTNGGYLISHTNGVMP